MNSVINFSPIVRSIFIAMNIQTWGAAVKAVKWEALTTMGGGYRYYLMGLFWFRMDYGCTLLLAFGNQRESFFMDVSRPQKLVSLDSGFSSGLSVVSLKKKAKEKKKTDRFSQAIHQELLRQAALCCFHHCIDISEADQARFTSCPLQTFISNKRARYDQIYCRWSLYRTSSDTDDCLRLGGPSL